jgi:hypothetical protein
MSGTCSKHQQQQAAAAASSSKQQQAAASSSKQPLLQPALDVFFERHSLFALAALVNKALSSTPTSSFRRAFTHQMRLSRPRYC